MKKTLVISNACFSEKGANGRTLKNLFGKTDADKLAQFFIYGIPDFDVCRKYYQVSDKNALKAILPFVKLDGNIEKAPSIEDDNRDVTTEERIVRKTPLKVLLREIVWLLSGWENAYFRKWLESFKPEAICLFIANNIFLIRLAIRIAKKYQIPIFVYTTEAYNFMDFNYLTNCPSVAYKIYFMWLRSAYKKITPYVQCGFFNNTLLRDAYQKEYGYPCHCIMNCSEIQCLPRYEVCSYKDMKVAYLGNLGLGRHKALIEMAEILQEIDKELYLDVYGSASDENMRRELDDACGVKFHGFVCYEQVVEIIHNSHLLVHVELNDEIVNRDLKYAFSTKIADCLCSGTPLLMYASDTLAETIFLKENECAFVANSKEQLKKVLEQALTDEDARKQIVDNACRTKNNVLTGNDMLIQMLS